MIAAFYPRSAAFSKVIYVIKYYQLLFYHPVIKPDGWNTKPSEDDAGEEINWLFSVKWKWLFVKFQWAIKCWMSDEYPTATVLDFT